MIYRIALLLAAFAVGAAPAQGNKISADTAVRVVNSLLNSSIPDEGLKCSFNITGNFTNVTPTNTTGSVNIDDAVLNCTGGTLNLVGGPALQRFNSTFSGVDYALDLSLPGATMAIKDQAVTFFNSTFKNLTPNGEASLILIHSNVTFKTVNFTSNKQATAGAIRANDSSNIAIFDSSFLNNTGSNAGALSIFNSSLFINSSTFSGNSGQQGGGVLFQNGSSSALRVANSVFNKNNATTGGGLFAQDCNQSILYNNVFQGNQAKGSGGGVFQLNCGGAIVLNAVSKNNATAGGGAYINAVTGLTLSMNEWTGNTAAIGAGAVDLQSVQGASISNDTFVGNKGQQGGAYFGTASTCSFTSCTFSRNKATLNGGGIFRTQGSGDITQCLFQYNTAAKYGGGVYDSQVNSNFAGNVFANNSAGTSSAAAVFRLQSSGDIADNNSGLNGKDFANQLPNATASTAVAG